MTHVRAHTRRKPSKPQIYIETHNRLRADVEAMRRGELPDRPVSAYAAVFRKLARAIGLEARV
jgi:hypothetical protein